nr:P-loop domain-containing protein [uncultured Acetatifactor sp.]
MKRLRYYLLNMKPANETYEEIYEGRMCETYMDKDPIVHNHALYWDGEIGYEITKSSRLELSKPTVVIHIPMHLLKIREAGVAALDYIFRAFLPYVRALNQENDNRKRTARENGHFFSYEPGSKVLARNVAAVNLVPQKYYRILKGDTIEILDGLRDNGKASSTAAVCRIVPIDGAMDVPAYPCVSLMLQVQLPLGKHKKAVQMLTRDLPEAVNCFVNEFDHAGLRRALALSAKQQEIRAWLKDSDYCAFVADGSVLPREKGSDEPMKAAVPFLSTPEDAVEVAGIRGMAFRKGVTVITGGGYSGKSTLLDALSAGIYDHAEGDGRELVITDASAMKISAEDGRSIRHVNLSPFIKWIPGGDPADFSTEHASGSTSQAANIMEAVGWGVKLLMIDEDKSATNFMIQDAVMKTLIEKEPITAFVERVRELAERHGVSTFLVIGGSSEYLQAADRIYMMKDYGIEQVTGAAKALWQSFRPNTGGHGGNRRVPELRAGHQAPEAADFGRQDETDGGRRAPEAADFSLRDEIDANGLSTRPEGSATEVLKVSDLGFLILGEEQIDIRMLHDIASIPQLNAIAFLVRKLINQVNPLERFQKFTMGEQSPGQPQETAPKWICRQREVERVLAEIEEAGLESAYSPFFSECSRWMDMPRKYEMLAVLSRMRLRV